MPTNVVDGREFEVNNEGFFTSRDQWDEELAVKLAALVGLEEMSEAHWKVLRFLREDSAVTGVTPTLRRLQTAGGFDIRDLYQLFPGKPAKKMSYLAGLPKPVGCV